MFKIPKTRLFFKQILHQIIYIIKRMFLIKMKFCQRFNEKCVCAKVNPIFRNTAIVVLLTELYLKIQYNF